MKAYKYIYMSGILLLLVCMLSGCKEDNTLEGADEVYIEISPKNSYIMLGDTIRLKVTVTNISGDTIHTPIKWSVDDENVLKIEDGNLIALEGSQGKATNVRAILQNGKYALSKMTVINHNIDGVSALTPSYYSYNKENDTVWFVINPKNLLLDYTPVLTNSNETKVTPDANAVIVKRESGMVGYAFSTKRGAGNATVTLTIGPSGNEQKASTEVELCPNIVSTIVVNPAVGTDFNSILYEMSTTMDINSEISLWVFTKITPSQDEDLANAEKFYKWEPSGNAAQAIKYGTEYVQYVGHRAYVTLRSAGFEGEAKVKFSCQGTELTSTINVQDYKLRYPVDELNVDKTSLTVPEGGGVTITPSVVPVSSYAIHQPKFRVEDRTIADTLGYSGKTMHIKGLKEGKTNIIITSNDKTVIVPIVVTEKVNQVIWKEGNQSGMFLGESIQWHAKVETSKGSTYPLNWASLNEEVAIVVADETDSSIGVITSKAVGEAEIYAEAGGKQTDKRTIKVLNVPGDMSFTPETTIKDGNAVYPTEWNQMQVFSVDISPVKPVYKGVLHIYITKINISQQEGSFDAATYPMFLDIEGAIAKVVSGTVTIKPYEGDTRTIEADLVAKVGNKQFRLKATIKSW